MDRIAALFVIIAATLWGVDGVFLRPYLYTLPVSMVVFVESFIITIILSPFLYRSFRLFKKLKRNDWLAFLGVAIMGGAVGTMAITKALFYVNYVNLSIVVLIQKLQPVFAIILASILLKEKPGRAFYIWAVLAVIGAYIMTFGFKLPVLDDDNQTLMAAFFAILATLGFASSTVLSKRALKNVEFKDATYLRFLFTAMVMLVVSGSSGTITQVGQVSSEQWTVFLIIAFLTGGPGIFLYYYGLKRIKASVATICELAFPLTAVLLEFFLRDNILGPVQWLGVAILFYSIMKVTYVEEKKFDTELE